MISVFLITFHPPPITGFTGKLILKFYCNFLVKLISTLIIFISIFAVCAYAAEQNNENAENNAHSKDNFVDKTHSNVSKNIRRLATRLDSLLGTGRADEEANKTRIHLYTVTTAYENREPYSDFNYFVHLVLPRTEEKFRIIIENTNAQDEASSSNPADGPSSSTSIKASNAIPKPADTPSATTAALRFLTTVTGFKTSLEIALRYTSRTQVFYKIRFYRNISLGNWVFRPVEQIFWADGEGHSSNTDLDFDRGLNRQWLFRFVNNVFWNDQDLVTGFTNGPSWYQTINERMGISYNIRAQSSDTPRFSFNNYIVSVGFRQLLYKKWFFWAVTPALSFPKERDFYRTPSLTIRFETVFGGAKS